MNRGSHPPGTYPISLRPATHYLDRGRTGAPYGNEDEGDESAGDVEIDLTAESDDPVTANATGAPPLIAPGKKPSDQDFVVEWQVAGSTAR